MDETLGVFGQDVAPALGKRMGVGDRPAAPTMGPSGAMAASTLILAAVPELFKDLGIRPDLP